MLSVCRLPWNFKVGKRQGAPAVPVDVTLPSPLPSQNEAGNPFGSLLDGRSNADVCDLGVIWNKCVDNFQAPLPAAAPMV